MVCCRYLKVKSIPTVVLSKRRINHNQLGNYDIWESDIIIEESIPHLHLHCYIGSEATYLVHPHSSTRKSHYRVSYVPYVPFKTTIPQADPVYVNFIDTWYYGNGETQVKFLLMDTWQIIGEGHVRQIHNGIPFDITNLTVPMYPSNHHAWCVFVYVYVDAYLIEKLTFWH